MLLTEYNTFILLKLLLHGRYVSNLKTFQYFLINSELILHNFQTL